MNVVTLAAGDAVQIGAIGENGDYPALRPNQPGLTRVRSRLPAAFASNRLASLI